MTGPMEMEPERVLAIDYGERRCGLALAEPGAALVQGLPTIDRRATRGSAVAAVARVVVENAVDRIVLGIPLELDGGEGPAARVVRDFESQLAAALAIPIDEWDERLTTEAARTRLREIGYSEREMRDRIDQLAAVLMLESYLQRRAADRQAGAG